MAQKENVMAIKGKFKSFGEIDAAPAAIVAGVTLALTAATCVADSLAHRTSHASKVTTVALNGRTRVAPVPRAALPAKAAPSAAEGGAAARPAVDSPRECDLAKAIDSSCIFN